MLKIEIEILLVFLGLHSQHMEVPKLGVKSELKMSAYTTATATQDLSLICNLHHSSGQREILNPLSKARDRTCVLADASHSFPQSRDGNSGCFIFKVDQ